MIQRWTVGRGGFIGEVSLCELLPMDANIKGNSTRTYVELTNLHIHPMRRGQGWATVLIRAALQHADERGWVVFLRCIPYNKPCITTTGLCKLYRQHGFKSRKTDPREMVRPCPRKRSTSQK